MILPGSLWSRGGIIFITAIEWLEEQKLIRTFEVRESTSGRRGMVILIADPQKDLPGICRTMPRR